MSKLTNQWLLEFSGEHLIHELIMFWQLAAILPGKGPDFETSVRLESWVIHLRNLIDFFYVPPQGDDIAARHFFDVPAAWTARTMPDVLAKAKERANKELSHLTEARKTGNPPDKQWDVTGLLQEIATIAKDFAAKASKQKLHPKVREFLSQPKEKAVFWVENNVTYSNIAMLDSATVSTATQLKGGKLFNDD